MSRTFSPQELSEDTGISVDGLEWLTRIGILKPPEPGRFSPGDAFRTKLIAALLGAGFTREQIEWWASEGNLDLDHVDNYIVVEPAPRSDRTFDESWPAPGRGRAFSRRSTRSSDCRSPTAPPGSAQTKSSCSSDSWRRGHWPATTRP